MNEIKVHVIQQKNKKPFLGGFRHRLTGVEYHNASIQTVSKKRSPPAVCNYGSIILVTFLAANLMVTLIRRTTISSRFM